MVLMENSATMNLSHDSKGDHITIHQTKTSSSGNKIVSNSIFLNSCSSSTHEQNILPNKYADIDVSQSEKEIFFSLEEDEKNRIVNDMLEQQYSLQNFSALENIQQSVFQEQVQLLKSYNDIINLPDCVKMQIIGNPVHKKEISDINNLEFQKSRHLLPWLPKDYTKLIHPGKQSHVVTIKKIGHINDNKHKNDKILSHAVSNSDILSTNDMYYNNKSNFVKKQNDYEKNTHLPQESKELKELNKKSEVSITRIRSVQEINLQTEKQIPNEWKERHYKKAFLKNSHSSTDVLYPKDNESMKNIRPCHSIHPLQTKKEVHKLESLSEESMRVSHENIILPKVTPIPIISSDELLETKQCAMSGNETREQQLMIREMQKMVPSNAYPEQTFKTFQNGNVLLVAPLSANKSNPPRTLLEPKEIFSILKSDIKSTPEEIARKDSSEVRHLSSMYESIYNQDKNAKQCDDTKINFSLKRKASHDSISCDSRSGIENEKCQYEDEILDVEKKKRRRKVKEKKKWQLEEELSDAEEEKKRMNAIKAKEHREKKKSEINELKNENMQWQLKYKELEAENKQLKSQIEMLKSIFPVFTVKNNHL